MTEKIAVGVTGSRTRPSAAQIAWLSEQLDRLKPASLHHGDCVGADELAAALASSRGILVCAHPPIDHRFRAFYVSDVTLPAKPFLERNHDIVDAVELLLALPARAEYLRSGTWATVRYARRHGVEAAVCTPDGTVEIYASEMSGERHSA